MGDVNVELVMAVIAFSGAWAGHQLGLRARRLELQYLAQIPYHSSSILRGRASQRTKPHAREADEAFGVGLIVTARFLEARDLRIVK